jgi:hypothetical protein
MNPENLKNLLSMVKGDLSNLGQEQQTELLKLLTGDVFDGKVLDILNSDLTIQVNEGQTFHAKMSGPFNFNIGDQVSFLVKETDGNKIVLKPLVMEESISDFIQKALTKAELPVNEKNVDIVKALVRHQMPVDKQTLVEIRNYASVDPEVDIDAVLFLKKNSIPVTLENLNQIKELSFGNNHFSSKIQNLSQQIPTLISEYSSLGDIAKPIALTEALLDSFTHISDEFPVSKEFQEFVVKISNEYFPDKSLPVNMDEFKEIFNHIKEITKNGTPSSETMLKEFFSAEVFKTELKELLRSNWLVDPQKIEMQPPGKELPIKELYKSMYEALVKLENILAGSESENSSSLQQNISGLKSNINFANYLNNAIPFVQIPIKRWQDAGHGDLYVMNRNKGKQYEENEEIKAFLHLALVQLGATDIEGSMKGKDVSTNFTLDNDVSMKLVEKHLPELKEKLERRGYHTEYSVKGSYEANQDNKSITETVFTTQEHEVQGKRYTFDVRA